MNGLLGQSWDDPRTMATLALAQGLLGGGSSMQRLAGGLQGYHGAMSASKREEEERKRRALQEQMQQLQLQTMRQQQQSAQAAQAKQATNESLMQRLMGMPVEGGMPAGQAGPGQPMSNAGIDPMTFLRQGGGMEALPSIMGLNQAMRPEALKPIKAGAGDVFLDPTTLKPIASVPEKQDLNSLIVMGPDGKPTLNTMLLEAKRKIARDGASSTSVSYGAPVAGVDASGRPIYFQPSKNGGAPSIIPGVAPANTEKPLTESQAKAAAFQSQMVAAATELSTVGNKPDSLRSQIDTRLASGPTNLIASAEAQRARQAQEQWAEAYLRFKTGAASTEDEVRRNVATYFPQPGDSAAVVQQKARQRQQAMADVGKAAGAGAVAVPASGAGSGPTLDDLLKKYGN